MGNSVFVELNTDFAVEIEKEQEKVIKDIIFAMRTGMLIDKLPEGITRIISIHRTEDRYSKIVKLMNNS